MFWEERNSIIDTENIEAKLPSMRDRIPLRTWCKSLDSIESSVCGWREIPEGDF